MRYGDIKWLLLSTLCLYGSTALGAYAEFTICGGEGAIYQPRWGQTEPLGNDLVMPYPVPGQPLVIKRGSHLGIRINWEGRPQCNHWRVAKSKLYRANPDIVYWSEIGDPHGSHRANETHCFPHPYPPAGVPNYVEKAYLELEIISCQGVINPIFTITPVYIVLDTPVYPMTIPWISVLDYSCEWARTTNTSLNATNALTSYFNFYSNYDFTNLYYTPDWNDSGEMFYLKAFLQRQLTPFDPRLRGQCNDFADFLLCLVTSIGAYEMKCNRTWSVYDAYWGASDVDGSGWVLETHLMEPAGILHPVGSYIFSYHQFPNVLLGNQWYVWDSSFRSVAYGDCLYLERENVYETFYLVNLFHYFYNYTYQYSVFPHSSPPWNPWPTNGFIPVLTADDIY